MPNFLHKPLWAMGLMSGTSADGIDAALIHTDGKTIQSFGPTHYIPYPEFLREQILQAYGRSPGPEAISLEQVITEHHAEIVFALLEKAGLKPCDVDVIGFHGQTLFHQPPRQKGEIGQTHIIGDGAHLAFLSGMTVIDQFCLNDVAHGGQGAPLIPIFHQALAQDLPKPMAFVNIGGVANITWIGSHENDLIGFDTGPGNGLIDDWVRENTNLPWDEAGKIAAQGKVEEGILANWLSHPYFLRKPAKSLDRKTFNACIEDVRFLPFEDGVATLTAFTAASIEKALEHLPQKPILWLVAGGGAHNPTLLKMMEERFKTPIQKASDQGWDGDGLEAQAFGFLAVRSLRNLPLTFPGTTGVSAPLSGGCVHAILK
jgi:anhydro-N-acetylmuramic acid kinase